MTVIHDQAQYFHVNTPVTCHLLQNTANTTSSTPAECKSSAIFGGVKDLKYNSLACFKKDVVPFLVRVNYTRLAGREKK